MNNPLISVIITNYNYSEYIAKSINSALNQTYQRIELIIINDGSTDNSDSVIKQTIDGLNNVTYISRENRGIIATRNEGLSLIKGDFFIFLDADNYWDSNYLEKFYQKIVETNSDVIYGDLRQFSLEGIQTHLTNYPSFSIERLLFDNIIDISALAKKWISQKYQFDSVLNHRSHEDWDFWLGVALDGASFIKCEENYLNYLVHENSRNQNIDTSFIKWQKLQETFAIIRNKHRKQHPEIFEKYDWLIQFSEMLYQLLSIQDDVKSYEEYYSNLRNQDITIYYNVNGYLQEKSEIFKFNLTASEVNFTVPKDVTDVRIDLTEIFSLFDEVILVNEQGTEIEPYSTNGIQINRQFYFLQNDPQIHYRVKNYQGTKLTLKYKLTNLIDFNKDNSPLSVLNDKISRLEEEILDYNQERVSILEENKQLSAKYEALNQQYQSIVYSRTWQLREKIIKFIKRVF